MNEKNSSKETKESILNEASLIFSVFLTLGLYLFLAIPVLMIYDQLGFSPKYQTLLPYLLFFAFLYLASEALERQDLVVRQGRVLKNSTITIFKGIPKIFELIGNATISVFKLIARKPAFALPTLALASLIILTSFYFGPLALQLGKTALGQSQQRLKNFQKRVITYYSDYVDYKENAPILEEMSPPFGIQGTIITLTGKNFGSKFNPNHKVRVLTNNDVAIIKSWDEDKIVAEITVPTKSGNVFVLKGIKKEGKWQKYKSNGLYFEMLDLKKTPEKKLIKGLDYIKKTLSPPPNDEEAF